MAGRTYNVEDRIRELGETPAQAYERAKADGTAGDAPPPTDIGSGAPAAPEAAAAPVAASPAANGGGLAGSLIAIQDQAAAAKAATPTADQDLGTSATFQEVQSGERVPVKPGKLDPIKNTGTLGDTVEQMPDLRPVQATAAPLEDVPTFGQTFEAARRMMRSDRSDFDLIRIRDGYAPIVKALGLRDTENPAGFYDMQDGAQARFGTMAQPSDLATAARQGEQSPFGSNYLATQPLQEQLIADQIRAHRAKDPGFLKGVPDTVDGLHAYFIAQEKAKRATAGGVLQRSSGLTDTLAQVAGGAVESFHDPLNLATLPLGGGGKTALQIAAREALMQGAVELLQQPIVADNRQELGEHLTAGEALGNVATAAAGGAVLGVAFHGAGHALKPIGSLVGRGYDATVSKLFSALPEAAQVKWASRMKVGDQPISEFFSSLSNSELAQFSHDAHAGKLTPDETAASNVLERAQEVGESSPYQPGPAGDAKHESSLAAAIKDIEDHRTPEPVELPSGGIADDGSGAASPAAAPERPPAALSTAARPRSPSTAPVDSANAVEQFIAKTRHVESGGDDTVKNRRSSAEGRFQITDGTFRDYYRQLYGADPGAHPDPALKDRPDVQERIMGQLTQDHAAVLRKIGEGVNDGNLYLMHFLGSGDGPRIFKADPSTPVEDVLSAKVLDANPYLRGKSASQVIAWAHEKMGGAVASVEPNGPAGALDPASEDPMVAQLRAEALQLETSAIGGPSSRVGDIPPMYGRSYRPSDMVVDADRFQFKGGGDESGVTDRLKGVTQWNPIYAGRVVAWEDEAGKVFVADGHQRVGLAKRLEEQGHPPINLDALVLREADGVSAQDARVYAALKNIAEGTGTPIDAAKVVRDAGAHVLEHLPPKSALVRDGAALARLSDPAFGAVYNDVLPADYAAVIGHLLPDRPEAHEAMVDLLVKTDPANRGQAESIVRQGIAAGLHTETQDELFGTRELVTSLMLERAKVLERGLARLRRAKLVFNTAATEANALERVGSKIAKTASEKEAQANAEAVDIVSRLAFSRGPVADALNTAARELADGGKLSSVVERFVADVRKLDLGAVSRETALDDASRLAPDGSGRGGDAGEEGAQLSAQPGDQEQPSLIDLERATERFSDPDGQAVKQQADSLVHDLKAELDQAANNPPHPVTGEPLDTAIARAHELRNSFPAVDPNETPGTHNIPNSAPAPGGGTRGELRERVLSELLAKPAKAGHEAHVILGPPASGKSTLADPIAAAAHARIIDSDDAKALLPEFENGLGAAATHEESALIAAAAAAASIKRGDNLVLPVIGKTASGVEARITELLHAGYKVYVHLVDLPNEKAVARSIARFKETGRLVEPDYVRGVGNKPHDTFEGLLGSPYANKIEGFLHVSNDVPIGAKPQLIRSSSDELGSRFGFDGAKGAGENPPAAGSLAESDAGAAPQRGVSKVDLLTGTAGIDPGKVARDRQLAELGSAAPLRAAGDVDQHGEIGLSLFDHADQPEFFRLDEGGEPVSAHELLAELADDDKAIAALKGCL